MKKMRWIAVLLALVLLLSVPAVAADNVVDGEKATAKLEMAGTTAEFKENGDMVTVTVTSNALKAGNQYVILMVKSADGENYTITADSILYIDQDAATASGSDGTVTFDVYPSAMTDGIILIAGAEDGLLKVAIIEGKYILGDVNADGNINADDALLILQHSVGLYTLTDNELLAANVHSDSNINADDALKILQYSVGIIGSFN